MHSAVDVQTLLASKVKTGYGGHTDNAFCRRRGKGPFFSKSENISNSLYYSVIETLWKLSPLDDRKAFFKKAKTLWVTNTRPRDSVEQLFSQADELGNDSQEQLLPSFLVAGNQKHIFLVKRGRPCKKD